MKVSGEVNHYTKYILFSDGPNKAYTYISVEHPGKPASNFFHKPVIESKSDVAAAVDCQSIGPCTSPSEITISAGGDITVANLTLGFVPTVSC